MQEFDYKDLLSGYGIEEGDIIDVSSDILSLMLHARKYQLHFDMKDLLSALKAKVGHNGTVMIRAFSWDFCHGKGFDIRKTKSQVGSLGNAALKDSSFKRTKHPMYSWLVWGKYQVELVGMNNVESFAEDSPFAFLYEYNGKHVRLGNTKNDSFSQRHYAELLANVPFRYIKMFHGTYKDVDGNETRKEYSMYVRRLDCDVTYEDFLAYDDLGTEATRKFDGFSCSSVQIKKAVDYIVNDLKDNFGRNTVIIDGIKGYKSLI